MADVIEITDFSAPELDVYARLTGAQLRACPRGGKLKGYILRTGCFGK